MKKPALDHCIEQESSGQPIFRDFVAAPLSPLKAALLILQQTDQHGLVHIALRALASPLVMLDSRADVGVLLGWPAGTIAQPAVLTQHLGT